MAYKRHSDKRPGTQKIVLKNIMFYVGTMTKSFRKKNYLFLMNWSLTPNTY